MFRMLDKQSNAVSKGFFFSTATIMPYYDNKCSRFMPSSDSGKLEIWVRMQRVSFTSERGSSICCTSHGQHCSHYALTCILVASFTSRSQQQSRSHFPPPPTHTIAVPKYDSLAAFQRWMVSKVSSFDQSFGVYPFGIALEHLLRLEPPVHHGTPSTR